MNVIETFNHERVTGIASIKQENEVLRPQTPVAE